MHLTFTLRQQVAFGQEVRLRLHAPQQLELPLTCVAADSWRGQIELFSEKQIPLTYSYGIYQTDGRQVSAEPARFAHRLQLLPDLSKAQVVDTYQEKVAQSYLFTAPFFKDGYDEITVKKGSLVFRARCALPRGFSLKLCGSSSALGSWDVAAAPRMTEVAPNFYMLSIDKAQLPSSIEFKFLACDAERSLWQEGTNHELNIPQGEDTYYLPEQTLYFDLPHPRLAGTAVPVFSLRSRGSCGVGDFGDLKLLLQWAAQCQQKIIQILPINDTTMTGTWKDSYPYNAISIYAFHPMYLDLRALPPLEDEKARADFERKRQELNALAQVDYEAVNTLKRDYLRKLYAQIGTATLASSAFKDFFEANQNWLLPYAVFSYLRDQYGTADFSTWPEHSFDKVQLQALSTPNSRAYREIAFYYFLQFELHCQLLDVSRLARSLGIALKGDIPIGVSRTSVEAWVEPYYFNLNGQTGAPPDPFAANGQNWGFPTYNWDVMKQDGYAWWRKRFTNMARYFSAYRIDHILGFFRIWQIPLHAVHGLLGHFEPALPFDLDEIAQFGLHLSPDFMTKPFINDELIQKLFGAESAAVKAKFLNHAHHDIYTLKPEFATQRQVEAFFKGLDDERSTKLRDGLYSLISDVLFVEDEKRPGTYHPRISVMDDYVFTRLQPSEQEAFHRLYDHYFYSRHNQFWYEQAKAKLPLLINSTPMLTCGEDLGMVPECVPWLMHELEILSLEIERMPKALGQSFNLPENCPEMAVCTTGTHDMNTLRSWWKEDKALTERYFHEVLHHNGTAPQELTGALCREIVERHLKSKALLCVLPLQDWLGISERLRAPDANSERINVPAIPRYYWRWRMHLNLEDLIKETAFNQELSAMIADSGRN
ncbi:MAG: 4-alpha-glucanotransferase [Candidatus Anaerobiospirillum merdipullorum]|uniref:4-alpha-glucanotransferase n=1 Tax=Candidatus Anaerobiospirillum merdipullorum TaxID=2838450 RepID=A0A9E2KQ28_9GAMM|nr:4-alpha-glucanotransferase [Candidatus Anaerobiospirillum merdipullorum]